jgi:hypothetical protein
LYQDFLSSDPRERPEHGEAGLRTAACPPCLDRYCTRAQIPLIEIRFETRRDEILYSPGRLVMRCPRRARAFRSPGSLGSLSLLVRSGASMYRSREVRDRRETAEAPRSKVPACCTGLPGLSLPDKNVFQNLP